MDQCATESLAIVFVNVLLFGDGGMAFSLESPAGLGDVLTTPYLIKLQCYEIFHKASDVDWWFGATQAVEKWNEMGLRGKLKQGSGQDYTARSFVIFFLLAKYYSHDRIKQNEMWQVWETREMRTGF